MIGESTPVKFKHAAHRKPKLPDVCMNQSHYAKRLSIQERICQVHLSTLQRCSSIVEIDLGLHMDYVGICEPQMTSFCSGSHLSVLYPGQQLRTHLDMTGCRSHFRAELVAQPLFGRRHLTSWVMQSSANWCITGQNHKTNTRYICR